MFPFVLVVCAIICAIASAIHNVGTDGLAVMAGVFFILAGVLKYASQQLTNGNRK